MMILKLSPVTLHTKQVHTPSSAFTDAEGFLSSWAGRGQTAFTQPPVSARMRRP